MNLGLKGLKLQSESSDERDELLATLAPVRRKAGGQGAVFLGTEVVVRKDRKAGAKGMALVGRALEEVVARPLETQTGEKPEWRKSNPGKEEAKVASQWWLSHGKSECGFPRGTGHQHEGERDDLGSQWLILSHTPHAV